MPKFTRAPAALVAQFDEAIGRLDGVERRQMFGYPAAFAGGNMFAGLFRTSFIVRLSEADRAEASALGATPFEPMPGRPMREYVCLPEVILGQPKELAAWLERARAKAASLPAKGSTKKPSPKRRR